MVGTFIALGYRFESAPVLLVVGYLLLAGMLVTVSVIDIACFRLPDRIVLPALGLLTLIVVAESLRAGHAQHILFALSGAAIYFGILLVVHLISPAGMGFGDVKLAALMGLYAGLAGRRLRDGVRPGAVGAGHRRHRRLGGRRQPDGHPGPEAPNADPVRALSWPSGP